MRKFAITDIHGCNLSFHALLDQISLTTADELYLLGDYIDRGPDSKGVLDTILQLKNDGYQLRCLMGNHDEGMLKAPHDGHLFHNWLTNWGGVQTLDSFNAYEWKDIAEKYWKFLAGLEYYIETDGYILVHAGLNFDLPDPFEAQKSLLFIRDWHKDINYDWLGERIIVHGHSPVSPQQTKTFLQNLETQRVIDIDNGCFIGNYRAERGHLCAFDMTNRALFFQKNLDDVTNYWAKK